MAAAHREEERWGCWRWGLRTCRARANIFDSTLLLDAALAKATHSSHRLTSPLNFLTARSKMKWMCLVHEYLFCLARRDDLELSSFDRRF